MGDQLWLHDISAEFVLRHPEPTAEMPNIALQTNPGTSLSEEAQAAADRLSDQQR